MHGQNAFTVATGVVRMDESFLEELANLEKRVQELDERVKAHGKELDRLRVDVGFWNTVLLEFLPEEKEVN